MLDAAKARFWSKVDRRGPDDCWEWTAARVHGYGQITVSSSARHPLRAHRVSYELARGQIPEGLHVLHRCDNRGCVNPGHLFAGTNADNVEDMVAKGRSPRGEAKANAKLTWTDVREIRRLKALGETQRSLAARFGIGQSVIWRVVNNVMWKEEG